MTDKKNKDGWGSCFPRSQKRDTPIVSWEGGTPIPCGNDREEKQSQKQLVKKKARAGWRGPLS
jgi:hypothetical protein